MLIECTIRRKGGTRVPMGKVGAVTNYHFKPSGDDLESAHVCEVANEKHAQRFLQIKESYRAAGKVDTKVAAALKAEDDEAKAAQAAKDSHIPDPSELDFTPVSEETMIEMVQDLIALMEEKSTEKKPVTVVDDLTNKAVTDFLEDQSGINVKNKEEIIKFGKGCGIDLNKNDQPGRMIKNLLTFLLETFSEEEGEGSDLGSDADTDEHAEGLTNQGDDEGAEGEDENGDQ